MTYFRELPDLEYLSPLLSKGTSKEYIMVKNLFRRVKLFDWIKDISNTFLKIQITEYARPDMIAEEYYGSATYDWVVLLTADIVNVQAQWPLSNYDLIEYVEEKYGIENVNDVHHWETVEVRDQNGRLVLPAGKIVDEGFTINSPDGVHSTQYRIIRGFEDEVWTDTVNPVSPVVGVSNYEYENRINEDKRSISILRPDYLQQFINDMRVLMAYSKSTEFINSKLAKVENSQLF